LAIVSIDILSEQKQTFDSEELAVQWLAMLSDQIKGQILVKNIKCANMIQ
jgi:hypothetical protein